MKFHLLSLLKRVGGGIFGQFHWSPPGWLRGTSRGSWNFARKHPTGLALWVLIAGLAGWGLWRWQEWKEAHRTRPDVVENVVRRVSLNASNPSAPSYDRQARRFIPSLLSVRFSGEAAALGEPEKNLTVSGVALDPPHPGQWRWNGESELQFAPSAPWPPGRSFTVTVDSSLALRPEVRLEKRSVTVTTEPLTARLDSMDFYIDPRDPANQQVVGSILVSHPFSKEELERHLTLTVIGGTRIFATGGAPWMLVPDPEEPRHWWARSAQVVMPAKEDFAVYTVTGGLTSLDGGEPMESPATAKLVVRDKFSGLSIAAARSSVIFTEEGEPAQHLFISTSGFVKPGDMTSRLELKLFPSEKDKGPWVSVAALPDEVRAAAEVVKPVAVPPDAPITSVHAWKLPPLPPGQLLVTVRKGLPGIGGYELEDDYQTLATVADFPKSLEFNTRGGLLSLNGERKMAVKARGVSHIRYTVARIPVAQINHLASMTRGRFESPAWRSWGFTSDNMAHVRHTVVETGKTSDWQAVWNTFDFKEFLETADPADPDASRGMFFLSAEAVEPRPKKDLEAASSGDDGGKNEPNPEAENSKGDDPDWQLVRVTRNPLPSFADHDHGDHDGNDRREGTTDDGESGPSRFVLVTDLGLLVKENTDGSRDVFVQSVSQGGPAAAVALNVIAKNGETLLTGVTDGDGHVLLPDTAAFTAERAAVVIVARLGNDVSFLPLGRRDRNLDFSRFETGGLSAGGPGTMDAFVFTERGVYRPGDTVHASLILRQRDGSPAPEGLPVTVLVKNSASRPVFRQTLILPADGMLECSGVLRESDPTGLFSLQVLLFPDNPDPVLIGRTVFRVEDFEPDRMKLKAELPGVPAIGWRTDPDITAVLDLQTLFGFPAAGRRITGKLSLAPADFQFEGWPDYTFYDRTPVNLTAGRDRNLGEIKSGDDGSGKIDLGLTNLADASVAFTFTAEAFELDSGRSVAVSKSGLFSPMTNVVGWKADGDLNYIGMDAVRRIHLVCIGPNLKAVESPGLTRTLKAHRQLSVLTRQQNGNYAYVSTMKEETLETSAVTIPADGLDFTLPTGQTGNFGLEFRDAQDRLTAACGFSVIGKGNGGRSLEQNAELQMKLPRSDWQSGEDLEVSLTAPFTGAGLLTIEREKVLGWKWFQSAAKESVQTIRVPGGIEGTAYVQAAFVRAMDSPEVFMSPLSYAVQPIRANYDRRLLPLTLEVPPVVKPGEMLHAILRSPMPARAIVYAVDEGIHQITNYQLPAPRDFFLRPRALEVITTQILDLLMPEFTILGRNRAFGGGDDGGLDNLTLNLNPFQRRREAPVVYWSGLVNTGPDGVTLDYPIPDYFAGQLTLMAVAAGAEGYGSTQAKTLVRGPFVLTPNAPVFAAPGDQFTLSLTVANNSDTVGPDAAKVQAGLTTSPNISVTRVPDPADIPPGREGTVRFDIAVGEPLGNATLTFQATAAGVSATRTVTLSVRPATPRMTTVQSGYYRLPDQVVKPQRNLYPEFAERGTSVSALPLNLARGLAKWLSEFPHGCTEQIISRAMPRILLGSDASFGFDRASAAGDLEKVFAQLRGRQAASGRFGLWDNHGSEGMDFLTVYAADFLLSTKEAGYLTPDDLLRPALKSLRGMAVLAPNNPTEQTTQARAIYLLTRSGEVTTNYLLNLIDTLDKIGPWQSGPAALWIASTHALLHQREKADEIVAQWLKAKKQPVRPWSFWQDQPLAMDSLDLALLSRHFPEIAGNLNYDDLQPLLTGLEKAEFNTYSAACCIQALKSWSDLQKQSGVQTSLTELTAVAPPRLLVAPSSGMLASTFSAKATGLQFGLIRPKGAPDLGAFYQVLESGFDRGIPDTAVRDGMEVTRQLTVNGLSVTGVQVGDSLRMTILIRNLGREQLRDLAVVDLLPGGWEVESGTLRPGPYGAPGAESVDMREDRNVFYCHISGQQTTRFSYNIRPVCAGTAVLPPVFANSMYRPAVQARGTAGSITSTPR